MMLQLILVSTLLRARAPSEEARIVIDAAQVEGRIDARLYGQFVEFMFEGVKGGLAAELVRNRGFEEAANAIGLSRHWERHPDDRTDDYEPADNHRSIIPLMPEPIMVGHRRVQRQCHRDCLDRRRLTL